MKNGAKTIDKTRENTMKNKAKTIDNKEKHPGNIIEKTVKT